MGTALQLRKAVSLVMSWSEGDLRDPAATALLEEIPRKWTIHGDCALLSSSSFTSQIWDLHPQVYAEVARILKVNTIARQNGPISNPNYRQPSISILFGPSDPDRAPIVHKKENGIWYAWDITKVMFSAGNISEKLRLSALDLRDQVVVDLYAGIGYFSLTFLIHSRAGFLYACEWNPDALIWLEANLRDTRNKIESSRYTILRGDNRDTAPKGVADRVNLGLIPSSEAGWEVAAAALKTGSGGILHIHGNVDVAKKDEDANAKIDDMPPSWRKWSEGVKSSIVQIFIKLYPRKDWSVEIEQVVKVKSYGPKVVHLVVDLSCRPSNITTGSSITDNQSIIDD